MIPLDKLRSVTHLITHANCPDGVASALIIKDALPDVRVNFVRYGTDEHRNLEPAPGMLFVDFSPWLPPKPETEDPVYRKTELSMKRANVAKAWRDAGVIVFDHHTRDVVEPYGELGVFGENERLECGAWLAYEHVWKPLAMDGVEEPPPKRLIQNVEDFARIAAVRDTWKKDHFLWEEACEQAAVLMFFSFEDLFLVNFQDRMKKDYRVVAKTLFQNKLSAARTAVAESVRFTSAKGTRVLVFQGVAATSDAAELLDWPDEKGLMHNPVQLVVGFHYRAETPPPDTRRRSLADKIIEGQEATVANRAFPQPRLQLQFSTRSYAGFDCQALARAHGGNGHRAAAGFTLSEGLTGNPYETFKNLLDRWERER